jgi:hypothetical protein
MTSLSIHNGLKGYFDSLLGRLIEKKFNAGTFEGIIFAVDYVDNKADKNIKWKEANILFSVFYVDGDYEELSTKELKDCNWKKQFLKG